MGEHSHQVRLAMFEVLVLVYAIGAVATFFWAGNMSTQKKGFVIAIPLALIWPIALIVLWLVAEKKKSN